MDRGTPPTRRDSRTARHGPAQKKAPADTSGQPISDAKD